jgi:ABC-type nitrate/sulfonate/bicarbonate transport system permease component
LSSRLIALVAPAVLIAAWALLKATVFAGYEFLPSPVEVGTALVGLVAGGDLLRAAAHTLRTSLVATAIAVTAGGLLGMAIGLLVPVRRYLMATIDFLRTIPAVALVPVAMLAIGPIGTTELVVAAFAATWPVVVNTAAGAASAQPRHDDVARTLHLSRAETFRKVQVPTAVPAWLVGAQLATVFAFLVAIVTEMLMYPRGLGGGIVEAFHALAPARMWAYVLVCGLLGVLLNTALRIARRALPGTPTHRADGASAAVGAVAAPPTGLLPLAAALAAWQLVAPADSLSFPPPSEWFAALGRLSDDDTLTMAVTTTLVTYALGLLLAALVGTVLGTAIGASRLADRALTGTIDFVATVPAAALVPLAALLLGPTQRAGVLVVGLVASLPITLSAAEAIRSIPAVRLEMSRTIGLSPLQRWSKVVAPSLAPGVLLGVRVAASLAVIVTLLVDVFGTGTGIGRLLVISQQHFDAAAAWGLLLIVGGFGYLSSAVLSYLRSATGHVSTRRRLTSSATAPDRTAAAAPSVPTRGCPPS